MQLNLLDKPGNRHGFTAGHIGIIAGCAVFLMFFLWMKNDFRLPSFNRTAQSQSTPLTYEEVRNKILAQNSGTDAGSSEEVINQLAQVDGSIGGQVLGASTDPLLPDANTLVGDDKLNQIKLKVTANANTDSVAKYLQQVKVAESWHDTLSMIAVMNSSDPLALNSAAQAANGLAQDLTQIPVPRGLEYFARIKIYYYYTLSQIGTSLSKNNNDSALSDLGTVFFSLSDKIDQEQQKISAQYSLQ